MSTTTASQRFWTRASDYDLYQDPPVREKRIRPMLYLQQATNSAFTAGLTTVTLGAGVTTYSAIGLSNIAGVSVAQQP